MSKGVKETREVLKNTETEKEKMKPNPYHQLWKKTSKYDDNFD